MKLAPLLARLGDALLVSDDVEQGVAHLEQALTEYDRIGDQQGVARVRIRIARSLALDGQQLDLDRAFRHVDAAIAALEPAGPSRQLAFAYTVRSSACGWALRIRQGVENGERAVAMARSLGEDGAVVNAEAVLGTNLLHAGQIQRAVTLMVGGITRARSPRQRWQGSVTTATHCLVLLDPAAGRRVVDAELETGRHDEAPRAQRGLLDLRARLLLVEGRVADARAVEVMLGDDRFLRASLLMAEGRWDEAEAALDDIAATRVGGSQLVDLSSATVARCQLAVARGLVEEADRILAVTTALLPAERPTWVTLRVDAVAAVVAGLQGDHDRAVLHLRRCREVLASGEDYRGLAGLTAVAEGTLAPTPDDADRHFAHAVATFARWHLPWLEADALLAWERRTGRKDQGRAAAAIYERIGAGTPWVQQALTA